LKLIIYNLDIDEERICELHNRSELEKCSTMKQNIT
jgi:hypothetical protein